MNTVGHALFIEELLAANLVGPGARIIFSSSESIVGMGPFPKPVFEPHTKETVTKHMNNTLTGKPLKWMGPGYMGESGSGAQRQSEPCISSTSQGSRQSCISLAYRPVRLEGRRP